MGEVYIVMAVLTFFGNLRKGFFPALIGAVLWPLHILFLIIMFFATAIAGNR
jgi:hypothetical protein